MCGRIFYVVSKVYQHPIEHYRFQIITICQFSGNNQQKSSNELIIKLKKNDLEMKPIDV